MTMVKKGKTKDREVFISPAANSSRELGVIFDMTVEDGDVELSVMDHGDCLSIGEIGPFDLENVLKLNKMLNQWIDKFGGVRKELKQKK